jgi:hypothetical protein
MDKGINKQKKTVNNEFFILWVLKLKIGQADLNVHKNA